MSVDAITEMLAMKDLLLYKAIYIFFTVALITMACVEEKVAFFRLKKKYAQLLCIVLVSLLIAVYAALRPLDTHDTRAYIDVYDQLQSPSAYLSGFFKVGYRPWPLNMEAGFVFLFSIYKALFHSFRLSFFCIAFFNSFLFLFASYGIAESNLEQINFTKLLALFFSSYALLYCCIAIRGGMSISVGLFAVYCTFKRKYILSLVFFYAAMLFHTMGILFVPFIVLTIVFRNKVGLPKGVLYVCGAICVCSLAFRLGGYVINTVSKIVIAFFDKTGMKGLGGYVREIDNNETGKRIWLTALTGIAVVYSVCCKGDVDRRMLIMILIGMFIVSFLYPITSISRASDYCYIFVLPIIASCRLDKLTVIGKLFMGYAIFPVFFVLQMTIFS